MPGTERAARHAPAYRSFRVTIDRIDQGRRDSSERHEAFERPPAHRAEHFGVGPPGNYRFTMEGLTWKGEAVPDAWLTIGLVH